MFLSVFDIFKVSVGPSSSHTMGPMLAAGRFREKVAKLPAAGAAIECRLYGSLAYTGEGHGTFRAVLCGLWASHPRPTTVMPPMRRWQNSRRARKLWSAATECGSIR